MCGIVGCVGEKDTQNYLFDGLKSLEYRGYDSAGVALISKKGTRVFKSVGRVETLKESITLDEYANIGIGHTRWATHGQPDIKNCHPHTSNNNRFYIVHNGVIENYLKLKQQLVSDGFNFYSDTDTEVIANIIEQEFTTCKDVLVSLENMLKRVKGSLALAIIDSKDQDKLYFVKRKSPLLIGKGDNAYYLASDALPMIKKTNNFIDVLDNQYGYITSNTLVLMEKGSAVKPKQVTRNAELLNSDLNGYPHYMLKEIEEIPQCINRLVDNYYQENAFNFNQEMIETLKKANEVVFIACGTSYHAALIGKRYMQSINKFSKAYVASEWAYFPRFSNDAVYIIISQSGETADAIKCLNIINEHNLKSIAITNTKGSTLEREATYSCLLYAGVEIAVASTKAYTSQVALLYLLKSALIDDYKAFDVLTKNNESLNNIIERKQEIHSIAKLIYNKKDAYFLARGSDYYVALEASLKLKEITYIHSEAFPAGELKHGPIALIEKTTPVIGFITLEVVNEITRNNFAEVTTRGAKVFVISTKALASEDDSFVIDDVNEDISSLSLAMVCQYLAYFTALEKKTDIDKPRNLAKSVTVE